MTENQQTSPVCQWKRDRADRKNIRLSAYTLMRLAARCLSHGSNLDTLTFQVAKTLIVRAFKFQTSNKRPFPPDGRTAICSYCLCYDEDKTLSQGSKSVSVRIFRVLVQRCFPHTGMTSTCTSCISPSLVS